MQGWHLRRGQVGGVQLSIQEQGAQPRLRHRSAHAGQRTSTPKRRIQGLLRGVRHHGRQYLRPPDAVVHGALLRCRFPGRAQRHPGSSLLRRLFIPVQRRVRSPECPLETFPGVAGSAGMVGLSGCPAPDGFQPLLGGEGPHDDGPPAAFVTPDQVHLGHGGIRSQQAGVVRVGKPSNTTAICLRGSTTH